MRNILPSWGEGPGERKEWTKDIPPSDTHHGPKPTVSLSAKPPVERGQAIWRTRRRSALSEEDRVGKGWRPFALGPSTVDPREAYDQPPTGRVKARGQEEDEFRVANCLDIAHEKSTLTCYSGAARTVVGDLEKRVGSSPLHLGREIRLLIVLSSMEGAPWNAIRVGVAALQYWHTHSGYGKGYNAAWADKSLTTWEGLGRTADHTKGATKLSLGHGSLMKLQRASIRESA